MPFLQDVFSDTTFIPVATERETYTTEAKTVAPSPRIWIHINSPTWAAFAAGILELHARAEAAGESLHPVDTLKMLEKCRLGGGGPHSKDDDDDEEMDVATSSAATEEEEEEKAAAEAPSEAEKIRVSVQNLVAEMVDIVAAAEEEEEEDHEAVAQDLLDEVLCSMFGVQPKTRSEKVAAAILDDLLRQVVGGGGSAGSGGGTPRAAQKRSVVVEPKSRERKRASVFDMIPDELIEKRRSSRKTKLLFESVLSSDNSNDMASIMTPVELLTSFLPPCLQVSKSIIGPGTNKRVRFSVEESAEAKKKLFGTEGESQRRPDAAAATRDWWDPETERQMLERFLDEHRDKSVWQLLRYFLDYMFR